MAKRQTSFKFIIFIGVALCVFITAEVVLRVLSHTDIDGNTYIGDLRIRPFFLPVNSLKERTQQLQDKEHSYGQYDPELGWSVRPSSQSENGLYVSNVSGIRTATLTHDTMQEPPPGTLRIAIFGDSFTHGDDVPFESTWGAILEDYLNQNDLKAEVLNLGGQGYGMDQAFLRWRKNGKPLKPHVVIFGFQNSNIKRNMSIIRMFYSPDTGIPFSKPRFVLSPDKTLNLINSPTLRPEGILKIYSDFDHWPLRQYEFYFEEDDYKMSPWYTSRFAAFIISGLTNRFSSRRKDYDFFIESSAARQITELIIAEFRHEVIDEGGQFFIVHLPTKKPLQSLLDEEPLEYQDLLDELESTYVLIDPAPALISQANKVSYDALFAKNSSHYSPVANQAIGEWIANTLLKDASIRVVCCGKSSSASAKMTGLSHNTE